MQSFFEDLVLTGPGDPMGQGSFFFEKGASREFHYKILSGGKKSAFDIILDLIIKSEAYDDTVYCIDEPDLHMHSRLQARLLQQLIVELPLNSQLWIATHSIGMILKAMDLYKANSSEVIFLDFEGQNFDQPTHMQPVQVNREFWYKALYIALDDLSVLVAPAQLVLCEGAKGHSRADFDARCYRLTYEEEFPDTDFISGGNEQEVREDRFGAGKAVQAINGGTRVIRLVDRDSRTDQEIQDLLNSGVRVLTKRTLESYLLDNEVLSSLCESISQPDALTKVLAAKENSIR